MHEAKMSAFWTFCMITLEIDLLSKNHKSLKSGGLSGKAYPHSFTMGVPPLILLLQTVGFCCMKNFVA